MKTIVLNGIARVERSILAEMPRSPRQIVRIFSDHEAMIQMDLSEAKVLRDWLKQRLDAGIALEIKAGVADAEELSAETATDIGRIRLQFSPQAASDFVVQSKNW
jgi:hypothetical protein